MTVKNADLIRAVLDGKTVQWRHSEKQGDWVDFGANDPEWAIENMVTLRQSEFRLKPEPLVKYLYVYSREAPAVEVFSDGCKDRNEAFTCLKQRNGQVGSVLRLELDPETLEVLKATTEAP